eukprot:173541-Prymnesium_polylepis.1
MCNDSPLSQTTPSALPDTTIHPCQGLPCLRPKYGPVRPYFLHDEGVVLGGAAEMWSLTDPPCRCAGSGLRRYLAGLGPPLRDSAHPYRAVRDLRRLGRLEPASVPAE